MHLRTTQRTVGDTAVLRQAPERMQIIGLITPFQSARCEPCGKGFSARLFCIFCERNAGSIRLMDERRESCGRKGTVRPLSGRR